MPTQAQLVEFLQARPLSSSRQIRGSLGASQATTSRLINAAGDLIVRVGRGRATTYSASTPLLDNGRSVPLSAVDGHGAVRHLAQIRRLADGRYFVRAESTAPWLAGSSRTGLFRSLPYFLEDQRPSGFLGRLLARGLAAQWNVAPQPRSWSHEELGRYLRRRADRLPGNLVLGPELADRVASGLNVEPPANRSVYPGLADEVLRDATRPGSSVAGEQPKFLIRAQDAGEAIVKFSPRGDSAEAGRWRDLLRAEWHAAENLRGHGFGAATCSVFELEGRVFLQSERFDRVGSRGRIGAISLAMIDAEFCGVGQGWSDVGMQLHRLGLLPRDQLEQLLWLETFGRWIGNTDMHLWNVSLRPTDTGFALLPVYDMLPMAFAPARGELRETNLTAPVRTPANEAIWMAAGVAAMRYFAALADDDSLTADFRAVAASQADQHHRHLDA